jgi:hypothetical protein
MMNKTELNLSPSILRRTILLGIVGSALGLGGCAVYPAGYGDVYSSETIVTGPVVRYNPPQPRVEVVGVAPFIGAVWIPGNWVWRDRWSWNSGHWARPPHARSRWAPGSWHHDRRGWRWHDGHWH